MASIRKRGNSYQITVSNGRRIDGSQIVETATFTPDPKRTEKQNQKALEKFVFEFEEKVKSGKFLDGEKITFQAFSDTWLSDYGAAALRTDNHRHLQEAATRAYYPGHRELKACTHTTSALKQTL